MPSLGLYEINQLVVTNMVCWHGHVVIDDSHVLRMWSCLEKGIRVCSLKSKEKMGAKKKLKKQVKEV